VSRRGAGRWALAAPGGLILAAGLWAAGCSAFAPKPDASHFYFLSAAAPPPPQAAVPPDGGRGLAVGLSEIGFPHYLERPELAIRVAPNELRFSPSLLWAEPLADSFVRVLAADLAARLGAQSVVRSPWYGSTRLDCVLSIDVEHFEPEAASGDAVLAARWIVKDPHDNRLLGNGRITLRRPLVGAGPEANAGAGGPEAGAAGVAAPRTGAGAAGPAGQVDPVAPEVVAGAAAAALSGLIDDFSLRMAQAVREAAGRAGAGAPPRPPR
jgi:uncharacterized lipoprotein YmbA